MASSLRTAFDRAPEWCRPHCAWNSVCSSSVFSPGEKSFNSHYLYPLEPAQADGLSGKKAGRRKTMRDREHSVHTSYFSPDPHPPDVVIFKTLKNNTVLRELKRSQCYQELTLGHYPRVLVVSWHLPDPKARRTSTSQAMLCHLHHHGFHTHPQKLAHIKNPSKQEKHHYLL